MTLPRTLWLLWFQGWQGAPAIVRACRRSWELQNPGWTVRALCAADLPALLDMEELAPRLAGKRIEPEALSDIVRIALLARYGGVWADATVLCLRPLDEWLPACFGSGFFGFARPKPDRLIASWFLASATRHPLALAWHRSTLEYWERHTVRHDYFWFHFLFNELCSRDDSLREGWERTARVSADLPHHYVPYSKLFAPLRAEDHLILAGAKTPVLKLTHKVAGVAIPAGSVLDYILGRFAPADAVKPAPPAAAKPEPQPTSGLPAPAPVASPAPSPSATPNP